MLTSRKESPLSNNFTYNEKTILTLLSRDSQYAFQLIYDRYKNKIYKLALGMLKSTLLSQEVVQDVFMKVWFERANLHQLDSFEDWLFIVARNHIFNQLKKISNEWKKVKQFRKEQESINFSEVNFEKMDRDTYFKLHKMAMANLTDHQKKVYELVKIDGFSYKETARQLNISPLTVKKQMTRALQALRSLLQKVGFKIF